MNFDTLKTELADVKYDAMSDQEAADSLNDVSISAYQRVDYADVASYLMVVDKYLAIKTSTKASAKKFMLAMDTFQTFNLDLPLVATTVTTILDALIADVLIDDTDKAVILSLADTTISRATEIGIGKVKAGHIIDARTL